MRAGRWDEVVRWVAAVNGELFPLSLRTQGSMDINLRSFPPSRSALRRASGARSVPSLRRFSAKRQATPRRAPLTASSNKRENL
jgi:hypothetical protein